MSSLPNIFGLFAGGGHEDAVRRAHTEGQIRRLRDAQGAVSAAGARGGVNPLAAARQFNRATEHERAAGAERLSGDLAAARIRDQQNQSQVLGSLLGTAGSLVATAVPGAAPAAPLAGAAGQALGGAITPQPSPAPQRQPAQAAAPAQPRRPEEEDQLGPLAMILGRGRVG